MLLSPSVCGGGGKAGLRGSAFKSTDNEERPTMALGAGGAEALWLMAQ